MTRFLSLTQQLCPTIVLLVFTQFAFASSPSPKGAKVYIKEPADGATVQSPIKVVFGIDKMMLMPAGVPHTDSGHHHLLIDVDKLPPADKSIPADKQHVHFGKAQTETTIELPPGTHTLQLLLGDHLHKPHTPPVMSPKITITVAEPAQKAKAEATIKDDSAKTNSVKTAPANKNTE